MDEYQFEQLLAALKDTTREIAYISSRMRIIAPEQPKWPLGYPPKDPDYGTNICRKCGIRKPMYQDESICQECASPSSGVERCACPEQRCYAPWFIRPPANCAVVMRRAAIAPAPAEVPGEGSEPASDWGAETWFKTRSYGDRQSIMRRAFEEAQHDR